MTSGGQSGESPGAQPGPARSAQRAVSAADAQALLDAVPAPMFLLDRSGRYLLVNRAWEQFTRLARSTVVGQPTSAVWTPQLAELFARHGAQALVEGEFYTQVLVPSADGHERVMWVSWTPLQVDGEPVAAGVATDVTELVTARAEQDWIAALVDSTADGMITVRNQVTASWNAAAESLLGYRAAEVIGRPSTVLKPAFAADPAGWAELRRRVSAGETVRGQELAWLHPDGATRIIAVTATPIPADAFGVAGSSWVVRDVGEQARHRVELERLSRTDDLTGLANRRHFHEQLSLVRPTPAGSTTPGAILVVDVDDFAGVNDGIGYQGGDEVLRILAERLRAAVGPDDLCARVGGDEFAVWCPNASEESASATASRIRELLSAPIGADVVAQVPATIPLTPSVSIGVVTMTPRGGMTALNEVDTALFQAKSGHHGSIVVFSAELHDSLRRRRQLATDVFTAVTEGQFRLVYQPVVRLRDASVVHVEALLRWDHPSLGPISPEEFIPIAESSQAIHSIGSWVIRTAARDAAAWQHSPSLAGVGVAVNVSGHQLNDPALPATVQEALSAHGLPPNLLILEITETSLMADLDAVVPALLTLRATGVGLAIDDFGTGYSSLSYLHRIPATQIKIDRSITADVTEDPSAASIVDSLTQLASALDLQVVAEGIELSSQRQLLATLGVRLGQGWLFSRPVEHADLASALAPPAWSFASARPAPYAPTFTGPVPAAQAAGRDDLVDTAGDHALTAAYAVDLDRRITSWDATAQSLTGFGATETLGRQCGDGLLVHVDEDGRILCGRRCPLQAVMDDGQPRSTRVFYRHADGHRVPAQVRGEPIRDETGRIVGARETFIDDTPHRRRVEDAEASRAQAHTDPLTGLPNWRRARIALGARLAHPRQTPPAAIAIHLADTEALPVDPAAEEAVIRTVATTLTGAVRAEDFLASVGRRDFLVLTAAATPAELEHYTGRLRRLLHATSPRHQGRELVVRANLFPTLVSPSDEPDDVLSRLALPRRPWAPPRDRSCNR